MKLQIFDVEHGACALATSATGARILIDCGHNTFTGWRPSVYLPRQGITDIDLLVVTNYDEDHVSDLHNLLRVVNVSMLLRNRLVGPGEITRLKSETGMGPGIEALVAMAKRYAGGPAAVNWGDITYTSYSNCLADFDDENNLSLVFFLESHGIHFVFPGDLEKAGWANLLQLQSFRDELSQVTVFVASHHGRDSGCCPEIFTLNGGPCHPQICVMSDMATRYDTQLTVPWYWARTKGIQYNGELRRVFTTRRDGRILFEISPTEKTINTYK